MLFADGGTASIGLIIGIVFVAVGLAFKVSAVPFHMWTPDVYEGAPTPVTAFFSVAPKIAAIALFVRVMVEPFGGLLAEWRQVIWFISVASMVLGAVRGDHQTNIKRLMAYSSIGHVGYALIGLAAGNADRHPRRPRLHGDLPVHECRHLRRDPLHAPRRQAWSRASAISPACRARSRRWRWRSASSCSRWPGIPPLAGFFAKLYVFLAAIDAQLYRARRHRRPHQRGRRLLLPAHRQADVFRRAGGGRLRPADRPRDAGGAGRSRPLVIFFFFAWPGLLVDGADAAAAALFTG